MAAPYIAYLLTSGCHTFRLCANVSSLLMRQKPTRSTVSNRHHTLAFTDVLVRPTAAVDLTTPTCREVMTCRTLPRIPHSMVFSRSTEGFSAPLASLYTVFFGGISIIRLSSYRHKALRYLLGRGILQIVVSAMPERTYWINITIVQTQSALWSE